MTVTEHDYATRLGWGHDIVIHKAEAGGTLLRVSGWGMGIAEGHFLILPNDPGTTRYRVVTIRYLRDPSDMWHARLEFAPRKGVSDGSDGSSAGKEGVD